MKRGITLSVSDSTLANVAPIKFQTVTFTQEMNAKATVFVRPDKMTVQVQE